MKDSRVKTHSVMRSWLQPRLGEVGTRWRLAARIRLANSRASRHPKSTFIYVVCTLLAILVGDMMFNGIRAEMNDPQVAQIAYVEPVFNGFRNIQANKNIQRQRILEMAENGRLIHHELDSLIALPSKSHTDSIQIIGKYGQLERIAKSLKQYDND